MRKMIELEKLDDLLRSFNEYKKEDETFEEFVEGSGMLDSDGSKNFDWEWVDDVGVAVPDIFDKVFDKEFVREHLEKLSESWFEELSKELDLGSVLQRVRDKFDTQFSEWKEKQV